MCVCALSLILAGAANAHPSSSAPPLPSPSGAVVHVATEPELQAAILAIASNTTIVIAPGTYVLTRSLAINRAVDNVGVRGATSNRDDVVIVGRGMTNADYAAVPFGIWTGGGVNGITIANLTIRDFYFHPIIFNAGTQAPRIYNVHLVNAGEQFIKSNPDDAGNGVNNGAVEYSLIEFETTARDDYPKGVDIHGAQNWVIRHNEFRNIIGPGGIMAGPGVLAWRGTRGTLAEGNTFINCSRGIMFGAEDQGGFSHQGGIIRNNFFYRAPTVPGDVGIHVADSPGTQVLNNTVLVSGTYPRPIEYRYPGAAGLVIANNLTDGTIAQRDGASATLTANETNASAAIFVNADAGDLHLRSTATAAIDQGVAIAGLTDDWDGEPRPQGSAFDIGADEFGGTTTGTYDISGRVTNAAGAAMSGIEVTLSGAQTRTARTGASGTYSFTGLAPAPSRGARTCAPGQSRRS